MRAFCDFFTSHGHEIVHCLDESIDLIFMQDPRYSDTGLSVNEIVAYKNWKPSTKIVHRVNECDARKGTQDMDHLLRECSKYTDLTIFVSHWMRDYHTHKGWDCSRTDVIYNGVNLDHFHPAHSDHKLANGKINIVTHHWANNRMKGFDVYEALDKFVGNNAGYTFTYIGRELGTFTNTALVSPLSGQELGKELSRYDVYVSGSLWDPGPNHIIEALASDLPTYAIESGGGAAEFVGMNHRYKTIEELVAILESKSFNTNDGIPLQSWSGCMSRYSEQLYKL